MITRLDAIAQLTAPGEPFELELKELYGRECRTFKNSPHTLQELYEESRCDETFLVYENERYTFDEAYEISTRTAAMLQALWYVSSNV